ncbi:hypothetical protein D3C73_1106510 [compost metagenome]
MLAGNSSQPFKKFLGLKIGIPALYRFNKNRGDTMGIPLYIIKYTVRSILKNFHMLNHRLQRSQTKRSSIVAGVGYINTVKCAMV